MKARVIDASRDNSERNSAGKSKTRAQTEVYRCLKKLDTADG